MPDPFGPRPCDDCGKELPYKVLEAGTLLYHGGKLDPSQIADYLEESLPREDRQRVAQERAAQQGELVGREPYDDAFLARCAINSLFSYVEPEHLAAAVRHYGSLGGQDSECERIEAAKWCHERGPGRDSQDSAVWAASICNLEAGHTTPHSFEQEPAATAS